MEMLCQQGLNWVHALLKQAAWNMRILRLRDNKWVYIYFYWCAITSFGLLFFNSAAANILLIMNMKSDNYYQNIYSFVYISKISIFIAPQWYNWIQVWLVLLCEFLPQLFEEVFYSWLLSVLKLIQCRWKINPASFFVINISSHSDGL